MKEPATCKARVPAQEGTESEDARGGSQHIGLEPQFTLQRVIGEIVFNTVKASLHKWS